MEAIFGLVGVIVGALVTGGTQLFLEWRRERRTVRRATLLVAAELRWNAMFLGSISALKMVPYSETGGPLATSAWEQTRSDLAAALDEALYLRLAHAYESLEYERVRLKLAMQVSEHASPPTSELDAMAESVGHEAEELLQLSRELLS